MARALRGAVIRAPRIEYDVAGVGVARRVSDERPHRGRSPLAARARALRKGARGWVRWRGTIRAGWIRTDCQKNHHARPLTSTNADGGLSCNPLAPVPSERL